MRKPAHQWQTRRCLAVRRSDELAHPWADDAHAESFDLVDTTGAVVGRATFGLARQVVDSTTAGDPDIVHAARCWLAARGRFETSLFDPSGRPIDESVFDLDALGEPPSTRTLPPSRIVTLAPSNAELLDALRAFDRVVACEDSSDRPAAVASVERLGPDLGPDLDRIAEIAPDLVVSSLSVPGMERVVTGLRARGVAQVVLAPRRIADVLLDVSRVGSHLRLEDRATGLVDDLREQIDALQRERPERAVRVYLEWWPRPMFSPGRDTYADELIALAGGINVFGDRPGASVRIEPQELIDAAPDVCFVSWCGVAEDKLDPETLRTRPGLAGLRAPVFVLDEALSGRPGPNVLEAARRMAAAIRSLRAAA